MHCDLNWTVRGAAAPHEWAFVDPHAYFDWHRQFGTNVTYMQAYTFGGYAFYPTRLGPVAPGPARQAATGQSGRQASRLSSPTAGTAVFPSAVIGARPSVGGHSGRTCPAPAAVGPAAAHTRFCNWQAGHVYITRNTN